jgi:hypothetical protein
MVHIGRSQLSSVDLEHLPCTEESFPSLDTEKISALLPLYSSEQLIIRN